MGKAYVKTAHRSAQTSLCKTCTYALIFTGYRESEQMTMCNGVHPNIVLPFTINTCTGYYDKNRPTLTQMQKLAIDVTPAPIKPVGFKSGPRSHPESHTHQRRPRRRRGRRLRRLNPFAGGEDNGYFIGRAPHARAEEQVRSLP